MIRPLTAAALLLAISAAAQANTPTDVPKHKCEPRPQAPGGRMMQEDYVRKNLQRDVDAYKACITAYTKERAAAAKANTDAANAAIEEYDQTIKAVMDAQVQK